MWAIIFLGLNEQADERAIKKAYAKRLKETRPDEDPAGFQQLNEAYQAALRWRRANPLTDATSASAILADAITEPCSTTFTAIPGYSAADNINTDNLTEQPSPANTPLNHYYQTLMRAASAGDTKKLNAWLQENTELSVVSSLLANYLLDYWQTYHPALAKECFDVLSDFFHLNSIAQQMTIDLTLLRSSLDAIWSAQQQASNDSLLTNIRSSHHLQKVSNSFEIEEFYQKCLIVAQQNHPEQFHLWLQSQQQFWSFDSKQQIGQTLLANLQQKHVPLSAASFAVILDFFNLNDILANNDITDIQDLQQHLNTLWLFSDQRIAALTAQYNLADQNCANYSSQESYADWQMFEQMKKPFSWLQAIRTSFPLYRSKNWSQRLVALLESNNNHIPTSINKEQLSYWLAFSQKGILHAPKLLVWTINILFLNLFCLFALLFYHYITERKTELEILALSFEVWFFILIPTTICLAILWSLLWLKYSYQQITHYYWRVFNKIWIPLLIMICYAAPLTPQIRLLFAFCILVSILIFYDKAVPKPLLLLFTPVGLYLLNGLENAFKPFRSLKISALTKFTIFVAICCMFVAALYVFPEQLKVIYSMLYKLLFLL